MAKKTNKKNLESKIEILKDLFIKFHNKITNPSQIGYTTPLTTYLKNNIEPYLKPIITTYNMKNKNKNYNFNNKPIQKLVNIYSPQKTNPMNYKHKGKN